MMITDCGMANLLSAIFGENRDVIKMRLGIPIPGTYPCPNCGKLIKRQKFCSRKCGHDYTNIKIVCDCGCGKVFTRPQSKVIYHLNHPQLSNGKAQERIFASKQCLGSWFGKHHGFVKHPENSRRNIRKWDYSLIWQTHLETGYGCLRLSRLLNIPVASISKVLRKKQNELALLGLKASTTNSSKEGSAEIMFTAKQWGENGSRN